MSPLSRLDLPHVLYAIRELYRAIEQPPDVHWQAPAWLIAHCNQTTLPWESLSPSLRARPGHSWLIDKAAEEIKWRLSPPYGGGTNAITGSQLGLRQKALLCELSGQLSIRSFGDQLASNTGVRVQFLVYLKSMIK
jgi:hypothetical protein